MAIDNILVLGTLFGALILFVSEKVRADVVALLVTVVLVLAGLITPEQAFDGFASPAVVTVWAVFIISGGLERSGVADLIGRYLLNLAGSNPQRLLFLLMIAAGVMSAFMNNIGAVAILMPAVISIGRKLQIPISKLLMPLAFAALLGGNITLIGTPPNILAASIMAERGIEPFRFFDFAPTGLIVLGVGIVYMLVFGQRLLPDRGNAGGLANEYPVRKFLSELTILPDSSLIGQTIEENDIYSRFEATVVHIRKPDQEILSPLKGRRLQADDVLLVEGTPGHLMHMQYELKLQPVAGYSGRDWHPEDDLEELHLAEVTLAPNSSLEGMTPGEINFRDRYGLSILAVRHHGESTIENIRDTPIQLGDSLLVQGASETFDNLLNDRNLLVLERPRIELRRTRKAPLAVGILIGVLVVAASGWLSTAVVMVAGALLIVLTGVLSMDEGYRAIDWKAVFLIAGMLPLGTAMEQTGTAQLLADWLIGLAGSGSPLVLLATFFIITALLTEVISNAAATVLLLPIAIDISLSLGIHPQPLIMTTVIAASTSFLMPIGHQVNIIIFGAGGYRFFDYTRVGVGLNILMLLVTVLFVPMIWPL